MNVHVTPPDAKTRVVIRLEPELIDEVSPLLQERALTIESIVEMYLRSLVVTSKRSRALGLADKMVFGKFKGTVLETVIRAEPAYVQWLTQHVENFRMKPDAIELLFDILIDNEEIEE